MYQRDGWVVTVEPAVPGSPNRPDFLVSRGSSAYYVEARCTFEGADRGAAARLNTVYAAVDRIDSGDFHLAVTVIAVGQSSPPTRSLRRSLETWLSDLDADAFDFGLDLSDSSPRFEWTHEDWNLVFQPIPRRASARDSPAERPLGAFLPGAALFVDDVGSLRQALLDKGSKYGRLDHSLVLAINIGSGFHDNADTIQALYGTVGWTIDIANPDSEATPVLTEPGFWGRPGRPVRTHIAGVLLAEGMHYGRVAKYAPAFWPHPSPAEHIEPLPVWRLALTDGDGITLVAPDRAPHDYFELPEGWPLGSPFPRRS